MSQSQLFPLNVFSPQIAGLRESFPLMLPAADVWVRSRDWSRWRELHGEAPSLRPKRKFSVAIVGTRQPSEYGLRVVEDLVKRLSVYDICIVSGGAFGIDRIAHEAALSWGLETRAWLVGPIASPGPQQHRELFRAIEESPGGALLVPADLEAADGQRRRLGSKAWLLRNSWVVADADAVVIAEAFVKSGTWQSAKDGGTLNKNIYGIPGPIFAASSQGVNKMISKSYAHHVWDLGELTESLVVLASQASYNIYRGPQKQGQSLKGEFKRNFS